MASILERAITPDFRSFARQSEEALVGKRHIRLLATAATLAIERY